MHIYQRSWRSVLGINIAIAVASSITAASFGANADLSDWVGTNNTTGGNNYAVTGPSSAGGTVYDRPTTLSSLGDTSLSVTPIKWNTEVDMSGTITFSSSLPVDPTLFIGWYNSADTSAPNVTSHFKRLGIGFADPIGGDVTKLRIMLQTTSTATTIASTGIFGTGSTTDKNTASTLAGGTYPFTFHYDGDGRLTGTFGGTPFGDVPGGPNARTWPFPSATGNDQDLDTFGFLQNSASGGVGAFTVNITNLSYTGQTDAGSGGVAGDYNHNGSVDAADYALWRKGDLSADGTGPGGTPDGTVNALDYNFWRARFGNTSGSGSSLSTRSAVPEPTTLTLAILSIGMLLVSRNRAAAK